MLVSLTGGKICAEQGADCKLAGKLFLDVAKRARSCISYQPLSCWYPAFGICLVGPGREPSLLTAQSGRYIRLLPTDFVITGFLHVSSDVGVHVLKRGATRWPTGYCGSQRLWGLRSRRLYSLLTVLCGPILGACPSTDPTTGPSPSRRWLGLHVSLPPACMYCTAPPNLPNNQHESLTLPNPPDLGVVGDEWVMWPIIPALHPATIGSIGFRACTVSTRCRLWESRVGPSRQDQQQAPISVANARVRTTRNLFLPSMSPKFALALTHTLIAFSLEMTGKPFRRPRQEAFSYTHTDTIYSARRA